MPLDALSRREKYTVSASDTVYFSRLDKRQERIGYRGVSLSASSTAKVMSIQWLALEAACKSIGTGAATIALIPGE